MAKKCDSCGGAVEGLFAKTCSSCLTAANVKRVADLLDTRKADYAANIAEVKGKRPDLAKAWEAMLATQGAKWNPEPGKNETTFLHIHEDIPALIPKDEKVLAVGRGVSEVSGSTWIVTDKSLIIHNYSIWNGNTKSSESIDLSKVTGIENKIFAKVTKDKEIIVTRAANVDHLSGVHAAVAEALVDALSKGTKSGGASGSSSAKSSDPADAIRKLKGLLDDGLITQDEFDKKKASLLEEM